MMNYPPVGGTVANQTYLFPYTMPDGRDGYIYLVCPRRHERDLTAAIKNGIIPDYARVIACGKGMPDERLRFNMERYYGYIYEHAEAA